MFDTSRGAMHAGGEGYPLRPELVESFYHACVPALILQEKFSSKKWHPCSYVATRDPIWISYGADVLQAIQRCKTQCGYVAPFPHCFIVTSCAGTRTSAT